MDSPEIKRQKLDKNTADENLTSVCNWSKREGIAVKHYEDAKNFLEITYAELDLAKLTVMKILKETKTSLFIGISFDIPSCCLPGLMLGIMYTKHAFVCLPQSPLEAQRICEKLHISHVFSPENIPGFTVICNFHIHRKTLFLVQRLELDEDLIETGLEDQIFAYAITTSGSTGDPKIVRVTHRSIVPNILDLKRILVASESDTIAHITPVTFDPGIVEIFLSLSCCGSLFMTSRELKNNPKAMLKLIDESRVSVLQSTPSLLLHRWSTDELRQSILGENSNLRILLLGGENFPTPELVTRIRSPENRTRVFDIYGITEVSCWASIREILPHDRTRILGKPLSETILEVRDEEGMIVDEGEGILHIGSNSRICVIDDEEIAQLSMPVFRDTGDVVAVDRRGSLTLKGRSGRRVKRYGTKLNLAHLESQLLQLPCVENCYALFMENDQSLHLFFTTVDKSFTESDKLKYEATVESHARKLPNIYHPDKIYLLDRFELTSNGKICRKFLMNLSAKVSRLSRLSKNGQETKADEALAKIWKRLLPSSGDSGFLDLGGTSVMALRIAAELADENGYDFPELVGRLLSNDNMNTCQAYVSRQTVNCSNIITTETNIKEPLTQFARKKETSDTEQPRDLTKVGIVVPWQKCRGRNSFPTEIESDTQNDWLNAAEIRLQKIYHLAKCVDASPTVFNYPGGKSYVTVGSHSGIVCTAELSKENSPDHWEFKLPDRIEASLLVLNDFKAVVGCYDGFVYCVHLKTGEIFWKFKTGDAVKCTAVLCSQRRNIFFGSYDHHVYCVCLENGSQVWRAKPGNGSISAVPWIDSKLDCVIFAMLDGTCASLNQKNGKILWRNKLDNPIFSAPVILKNGVAVFCDVSGKLSGFSASTGEKIWRLEINGTVFSHLVVNTEPRTRIQSLLFASNNRKVYKLDCSSKEKAPLIQLKEDVGAPVFSTPWTDGKVIAVVGTDGELKLLEFVTGKLLSSLKLGGDVFSSPIIHENFIVVGCRDDNLYVLTFSDVRA